MKSRSEPRPKSNRAARRSGDPRATALEVLTRIESSKLTLDSVMETTVESNSPVSRRDRALLNALVYGVLRWRGKLDWIISQFSKSPIKKISPEILNILRLGLYQILYLDRVPVSAAVNTSVELAKRSSAPWAAGFVNGVLRNAARNPQRTTCCHLDGKRGPATLAITGSLPVWLIERWLKRFGTDSTQTLCEALNTIPPITIRANSLKTDRATLQRALEQLVEKPLPGQVTTEAISFRRPSCPIIEMKPFKDGWFQVQDESAQLISWLLEPQPGETVLDACAGLGGKTGHIAQLMQNQGQIIAVDKAEKKLIALKSEMNRLGISIVKTRQIDLQQPPETSTLPAFDRILLDAPCSGLGVLRRNPDTRWNRCESDLRHYQARQIRLLTNLAPLVKPTGWIVYAVCSSEPEEGEAVIRAFLKSNPKFTLCSRALSLNEKHFGLIDENGFLSTYPNFPELDGFFAARLQRLE